MTCEAGRFYCFEIRTKDVNYIRFTYTPSLSANVPVNITAAIATVAYPPDPKQSFAFCNTVCLTLRITFMLKKSSPSISRNFMEFPK